MENKRDQPAFYYDLYGGNFIVGEDALSYHLHASENGGYPAVVYKLVDLLTGNELLPSFGNSLNDKYNKWTEQDFITCGQWLLKLLNDNGYPSLTARILNRASHLDLAPSETAVATPDRFGSITGFQEAIGQEIISWYREFDDWDVIDMTKHMKKVGEQEGRRPTAKIVERRIAEGKKEPGYDVIIKVLPFSEAYERAGYLYPKGWSPRRYQEWGYLFYLANNRLPTKSDLDTLSPIGLGPSSRGADTTFEGSFINFKKSILNLVKNRRAVQRKEILLDFNNGLPRDLGGDAEDNDHLIRAVGRFKVAEQLFPSLSKAQLKQICSYDVVGDEFADYLKRFDGRIENWMVEAIARRTMYYPEIFPNGVFMKLLKLEKQEKSYINGMSPEQTEKLTKIINEYEETRPNAKEDLTDVEEEILHSLLDGETKTDIAIRVIHYANSKQLNRKYLQPLRQKLGVRQNSALPRRAAELGLINKDGVKDYPLLTKKQIEILTLMSYGINTEEIVLLLGMAPITIRNRVGKIIKNLNAKNPIHAISISFKAGILTTEVPEFLSRPES